MIGLHRQWSQPPAARSGSRPALPARDAALRGPLHAVPHAIRASRLSASTGRPEWPESAAGHFARSSSTRRLSFDVPIRTCRCATRIRSESAAFTGTGRTGSADAEPDADSTRHAASECGRRTSDTEAYASRASPATLGVASSAQVISDQRSRSLITRAF